MIRWRGKIKSFVFQLPLLFNPASFYFSIPIYQISEKAGVGPGCGPYKSFSSPAAGPILTLPFYSISLQSAKNGWGQGR